MEEEKENKKEEIKLTFFTPGEILLNKCIRIRQLEENKR